MSIPGPRKRLENNRKLAPVTVTRSKYTAIKLRKTITLVLVFTAYDQAAVSLTTDFLDGAITERREVITGAVGAIRDGHAKPRHQVRSFIQIEPEEWSTLACLLNVGATMLVLDQQTCVAGANGMLRNIGAEQQDDLELAGELKPFPLPGCSQHLQRPGLHGTFVCGQRQQIPLEQER